jgi:ABC-type branched-subunit amino acid transport system permease subunit
MSAVFSVADIYFAEMHPILAGALIIAVMKFMPNGLVGLARRFGLHRDAGTGRGR